MKTITMHAFCVQEQREALESCIDDDSYVYEALEKVCIDPCLAIQAI